MVHPETRDGNSPWSAVEEDEMQLTAFDVQRADGVAEVTLLGPGRGNAMGPAFFEELPRVFEDLDAADEVRAVVLRGSGDHFCYGLDLMAMMGELAPLLTGAQMVRGRTRLLDLIRGLQRATDAVAECRKPVVCALHGWCIGGGLDLAAACDIRLCSADARFSLREVRVAIVADLGSLQRLPRIIGDGAVRDMALTGRDIDAPHALRIGLVSDVLDDVDALLAAARERAALIAANPPLTVQGIVRVLNHAARRDTAADLEYVAAWNAAFLQSADLMEAMAAFAEKRDPVFKGE